jgi:hypothetical protein
MAITALADIKSNFVDITTIPAGQLSGVVLTNGAAPLTANWNAGAFSITSLNSEDCINASAYGMVADGSLTASTGTDNTTPLTNAINAAIIAGKKLRINAGIYKISSNVLISDNFGAATTVHIDIEGSGSPSCLLPPSAASLQAGGTILKFWTGAGVHGITMSGLNNTTPIFTLKNIEIFGPDSDVTTASGNGLHLVAGTGNAVPRIDFENVSVHHWRGGKGVFLNNCENGYAKNLDTSWNDVGLSLNNATNANTFVNWQGQTNVTRACEIIGGSGANITQGNNWYGGLVQNNTRAGIYINGGFTNSFYGMYMENNNATAIAGSYGFHVTSSSATVPSNYNSFRASAWNQGSALDTIFVEATGAGVSFSNYFESIRFNTTGPTVSGAGCAATQFRNCGAGTLTDTGTGTSSTANNASPYWDNYGAPMVVGGSTGAPNTGIGLDVKCSVALRATTGGAAIANGANQNYGPGTGNQIVVTNGAPVQFGGITGGVDGRLLTIINATGGSVVTLNHNDAGSSAGNKIFCPTGAALALSAQWGCATLAFCAAAGAWVVTAHN